jgi:two-component system response regulator VanR
VNKKILVVEDDTQIQELIAEFLKSEEYIVETANDGIEGYEKFKGSNFDLVILDVMMPRLDGYGLCKMIRAVKQVPIIFLTALNEEDDEVKAFNLEADDYITKPFSFNVLIQRVKAVLRRYCFTNEEFDQQWLTFEDLKLNNGTYKAYLGEEVIDLTLKEYNILKLFIESYPRVVTREMLMDKIWGYDYYGDMRVIDAHIKNIRKKIQHNYIKTVKGIGYVLEK